MIHTHTYTHTLDTYRIYDTYRIHDINRIYGNYISYYTYILYDAYFTIHTELRIHTEVTIHPLRYIMREIEAVYRISHAAANCPDTLLQRASSTANCNTYRVN